MMTQPLSRSAFLFSLGILATAAAALAQSPAQPRWYKGNTHTHTWWSDGDTPPELVVKWYKDHGYHFLTLSDHNILSDQDKWYAPTHKAAGRADLLRKVAAEYEKAFGPDWIEKRTNKDQQAEYRLKTLTEFRPLFEEAGKFLLIQGEEISDAFDKKPVHVNGVNLKDVIKPQGGATMYDTMQNNINAVLEQEKRTRQPMFPHLNHPNFHWANPVEDIMRLRGEKMFEIHNGHPAVNNYGDAERPGVERMWDIILTRRLTDLNLPVMYGLATDDAHCYTAWGTGSANPGRGWVMVQAKYLTPQHIVEAMKKGEFYASTGVVLEDIGFEDNTLSVRIQARPGVQYKTQFIGTLVNYKDAKGSAAAPGDRTNSEIGKVLAEQPGTEANYKLTGKEVYVRAKVISTAKHPNPYQEGDVEVAWVQPVQPGKSGL